MTDPKLLTWALDQARRDLIDLTRRNRLLHAPLEGKRPWCMVVTGHTPDELFEKLYRQENFRGYAFKAREEEPGEQQSLAIVPPDQAIPPQEPVSTRRPRLQTRLAPEKLQKRLTKIFREERTLEEEQGLSTLYLALGFLKWFDSDQAEESCAPLLLLPVTMTRVAGADGYLLRGRDDDIVANISLREKLKSNFDINLSEIADDEHWKPSTYYDSVTREIRRQRRWHVEREAVGLGFFTFSKFLMWRDLHPEAWLNNSLLEHPLVNILLGQGSEFEKSSPLVPDNEAIDHHIDLSKCTHVVDADSSQAIVIEEARAGRNLVVQGPPGTGKSQTITNAIASAVHNGKTVLFVAEKTAALEVVHERLRKAGLGALCLEIHSRKANKREVLKSLEQALRFSGMSKFDSTLASKVAVRRDKLNLWSSVIHKPIGQTGRTAFDVIGRQVKLRTEGVRLLETRLDAAAKWSTAKLTSIENAADRAAASVSRLSVVPKDHPWFGTNIDAQSPFDLERLIPTLNTALEKLALLGTKIKDVIEAIAENHSPSIADALATIKSLRHLAVVPEQDRSVLGHAAWASDLASLEIAIDHGQRLAASINEVDEHFRPEAWTCDAANLLLALRADGESLFRGFSGRYRRANADLRAICRARPPKKLKDRIALVEMLKKGQESRHEFAKKMPLLSSALGSKWAEHKTSWPDVRTLAAWSRCAMSELGGARLLALAARAQDLRVFSFFADNLEEIVKAARLAFDRLQQAVRADVSVLFGCENYVLVPVAQLSTRMSIWRNSLDAINDWVSVRDALIDLRLAGLGVIADGLIDRSFQPKEARPITELLIAESLWRRATEENPELNSIDGIARTECVNEFREFDQQRIRAARQEVLARYLDQRPNGYAGAMGIIRAEIEKKRGHRPIRKLMSAYHSARSARDRDRLRQEVLEGLGWRLHRIWSTDWFRNPQRETDKLLAAIKDAKDKKTGPKIELIPDDDLPELDESESETGTPQNGIDESELPSNTVPYKECALTVPIRRELLDLSVLETSRLTLAVVEAEGPIHAHEVARRIREAFGLQKTGKRILTHVRSSLNHLSRSGSVTKDNNFWSVSGQKVSAVRNRRNAALALRRATMIAPEEYQLAITTIITDAVAISKDDLVVETARLFGFDRTGPDLKDAIDRQVEKLVNERRLCRDEIGLRLPDNGTSFH